MKKQIKGRQFDKILFCGSSDTAKQIKLLHNILDNAISNLSGLQQPFHPDHELSGEETRMMNQQIADCELEIENAVKDIAMALLGKELQTEK